MFDRKQYWKNADFRGQMDEEEVRIKKTRGKVF
jgi:hypothetical protein